MKILHVYKDFDPPVRGGIERHVALMCRFQQAHAAVAALTCSRTWRTRVVDRHGTRVTEVGEWGRFQNAPVAPLFPWHLRRQQADVVVVHMPNPTGELGFLLSGHRGRLIVRYHSDVVRQAAAMKLYGAFQMRLLRRADAVLPTSENYLNTSPYLGGVRAKCRVVPLGIVTEDFAKADAGQVAALREQYGGAYVLFTGRHRYYKGLDHLVRAAPSIAAPVVITGEGPDTRALQGLAEALRVKVHFPGVLSDAALVNHLHGCAVFAFPSVARSEAFGISILEAHACGKPVVATRLGTGVEFANLHDVTGLNVAPGDAAALAAALNTLLNDADLRARMGQTAKERVERAFHARNIAEQELTIYERVLAGGL
jgi:glycosyltransferase involved in cell wall biosynthesis